jgi:riboflavin kinase/FMN adenylyltransferase
LARNEIALPTSGELPLELAVMPIPLEVVSMITLSSISELSGLKGPVALAIGVFDGVHLGHQEVIRDALDFSEKHGGTAVVMTFDPHPIKVLRPEAAPRLLCSSRHKLRILEKLGVSHTVVVTFDQAMAQTSAEQFVEALVTECHPLGFISVGYTWAFGKGRSGNIHRLMELGEIHGFGVYGVPAVQVNGETVSSTLIREAVREGNFERAKKFLGRDYTVLGNVVKGKQLGRQLGFHTANVSVENEELPPSGVYAVTVQSSGFGVQGRKGVANLGFRPTVDPAATERALEVHLLDYEGDLYGSELEVAFVRQLREERKFSGLEELKLQIANDVAEARGILG